MYKKILLTFICLISLNIKAQEHRYEFFFDRDMSSKSYAHNFMSVLEAYKHLDDKFICSEGENNFVAPFTRFLSAYYVMLMNHEIGGHGVYFREFGLTPSYKWGWMRASTSTIGPLLLHEDIIVTTAGMQASEVLSEVIKSRYIESNNINPVYGIAYFMARLDQPMYIWGTKESNNSSGNDVHAYITGINKLYDTDHLSISKLKSAALLDLLDPFLYSSFYSYIMNKEVEVPMFQVTSNMKYVPAFRTVLTPWGLETSLLNHFKFDDKYVQLNFSYGNNKDFTSYSIGLKTNQVIKFNQFSLGFEANVWSQPKLFTANPLTEKCKTGGMFTLNSTIKLNDNYYIMVSAGYKSEGFVKGYPVKKTSLIMAGLGISM